MYKITWRNLCHTSYFISLCVKLLISSYSIQLRNQFANKLSEESSFSINLLQSNLNYQSAIKLSYIHNSYNEFTIVTKLYYWVTDLKSSYGQSGNVEFNCKKNIILKFHYVMYLITLVCCQVDKDKEVGNKFSF